MKHLYLLLAFAFSVNTLSIAQDRVATHADVKLTFQKAFEILENIGSNPNSLQKLDSVLNVANNALKSYPINPSKEDVATYVFNKGGLIQLYIAIGKLPEAEIAISELLIFAQQHNDMQTVANYEYYMASVCYQLNKKDVAIEHYQLATKVALELKDYSAAANGQIGAATVYNALKQFNKAINASKLTITYGELNNNNKSQIGSGWHLIGAIYFEEKKYDKSIDAFKKAALYYEKADSKELLQVVQSSIDKILAQTGKEEKVVEKIIKLEPVAPISKKVVDTLDTVFQNTYEVVKTQKMLSEFDAADKQTKLETLRGDYLEQQAESLRARIWYILGLSLLTIAALILLYTREIQKRKAKVKMTQKYIEGLESERERISKELHDGVCNDLLGIEMALCNEGANKETIAQLSRSRDSVRDISHQLLPPEFQHASIDEILLDYVTRTKPSKINITYHSDTSVNWNSIERDVAFAIYRIVQEALSNSIKHSGASHINVLLSKTINKVSITISDNGCGMNLNDKFKGIGLQTINERVKSVNGELDIKSTEQGTIIKVDF